MAIVPIFIHIKEKSDKELREEMKRDARWNKLMREEEERERQRKEEEKRKKEEEKRLMEKKANEWWWNLENTNEWETRLLPEGWSMFGQQTFQIISERNSKNFTKSDI